MMTIYQIYHNSPINIEIMTDMTDDNYRRLEVLGVGRAPHVDLTESLKWQGWCLLSD